MTTPFEARLNHETYLDSKRRERLREQRAEARKHLTARAVARCAEWFPDLIDDRGYSCPWLLKACMDLWHAGTEPTRATVLARRNETIPKVAVEFWQERQRR